MREKIDDKIMEILDKESTPLSIRKITELLKERFDMSASPQIVKRHLLKLVKEGKILQKNG